MEEYVNIGNFKLWTIKDGSGEPVLFCHGGPGLWDYLKPVSDMITDRATVLRYEQRGCGRSGGSSPYTVESNIEDIETLRQHWGVEQLTIVGHSWGANLAMAYALKYPERTKAVAYLCGTGITYDWSAEYKQNWSERLTRDERERLEILKVKLADRSADGWEEIDNEYCRLAWSPDFSGRSTAIEMSGKLLREGFHPNYEVNDLVWGDWKRYIQQPDLGDQVGKIALPFLVIAGSDDPRPCKYLKEFAAQVPAGKYVEIEGAGHYPWLEDGDAIGGAIRNFLFS